MFNMNAMDSHNYRQVMSCWPTGVSVVTGLAPDLGPRGLVIGSFASVSLSPPLVSFFVKAGSTSWQDIRGSGRFCVNVLSTAQAPLVSRFSRGDVAQRFAGLPLCPEDTADAGRPPHLADCAAWVCAHIAQEIELGDHLMVVGKVQHMARGDAHAQPLVFAQGRLQQPQPLTHLAADHFAHWESALLALLP